MASAIRRIEFYMNMAANILLGMFAIVTGAFLFDCLVYGDMNLASELAVAMIILLVLGFLATIPKDKPKNENSNLC